MTTVKEIFQNYAPVYVRRLGDALPFDHRKLINAIINCRTGYHGANMYQCEQCGRNHMVFRSCENPDKPGRRRRHRPSCQQRKTLQWSKSQTV